MSHYENLISDLIDAGLHEQEQYYNFLDKIDVINRVTPSNITSLQFNEVFVFGSNNEGKHGKGAAKFAYDNFGAIWGQARGLQGQSYAIVSKSDFRKKKSSSLEEIQDEVQTFIRFAKQHPNLIFKVTPIGTGLAGYSVSEIAPLFKKAVLVTNIHLPQQFWDDILDPKLVYED